MQESPKTNFILGLKETLSRFWRESVCYNFGSSLVIKQHVSLNFVHHR